MRPVVVGALLRPLPVQTRQFGAGRRRDAGRHRQSAKERLVALARVPAHDAPQRRARCVSTSIRRRVRETVEWSGGPSCSATSRNCRRLAESAVRPTQFGGQPDTARVGGRAGLDAGGRHHILDLRGGDATVGTGPRFAALAEFERG